MKKDLLIIAAFLMASLSLCAFAERALASTTSAQVNAKEGKAAQLGKVICPAPTRLNSGFVGEDQDGDGNIDHVWRVYLSGPCAGETIGNAQVIK